MNIRFLSDHRIEINVSGQSKVLNYAAAGFENRKTNNPNTAWVLLREVTKKNGRLARAPHFSRDTQRLERECSRPVEE